MKLHKERPGIRTLANSLAVLSLVIAGWGVGHAAAPNPKTSAGTIDAELVKLIPASWKGKESSIIGATHLAQPYTYADPSGKVNDGILFDLWAEVKKRTGVTITPQIVDVTTLITGVKSGRFQLGAPLGDFKERQKDYDFVDIVSDKISVLAKKGGFAPKVIADLCGHTMTSIAGGQMLVILGNISTDVCEKSGKQKITINPLPSDQAAVLAVQSGRVEGTLELSFVSGARAVHNKELQAFPLADGASVPKGASLQGIMTPKGSGTAQFLQAVLQKMQKDGSLRALFKKYGADYLAPTYEQITINGAIS